MLNSLGSQFKNTYIVHTCKYLRTWPTFAKSTLTLDCIFYRRKTWTLFAPATYKFRVRAINWLRDDQGSKKCFSGLLDSSRKVHISQLKMFLEKRNPKFGETTLVWTEGVVHGINCIEIFKLCIWKSIAISIIQSGHKCTSNCSLNCKHLALIQQ